MRCTLITARFYLSWINRMIITNIKALVGIHLPEKLVLRGSELANLPLIENAWLLLEDGLIKDYGLMTSIPAQVSNVTPQISAQNKYVIPSWCDSHTHIVFAASREEEFVMKIEGKTYEEIAAAGGGILNSARRLADMSEDELYAQALARVEKLKSYGTGALEIKSGYGLSVDAELKMLRVIRRLKEESGIAIIMTIGVLKFWNQPTINM